jgi:hypothetical protein
MTLLYISVHWNSYFKWTEDIEPTDRAKALLALVEPVVESIDGLSDEEDGTTLYVNAFKHQIGDRIDILISGGYQDWKEMDFMWTDASS